MNSIGVWQNGHCCCFAVRLNCTVCSMGQHDAECVDQMAASDMFDTLLISHDMCHNA